MELIDTGAATLSRARKGSVAPQSIVIWDSDNLVLNTNINMTELFDNLVFLENETATLKTELHAASVSLGLAIARNQYNSGYINEHQANLSAAVLRINDVNRIAISEINKVNSFDLVLTALEDKAGEEFSRIQQYVRSINSVILNAATIEGNTIESELTVTMMERDISRYQSQLDQLEADLRDIEFTLIALAARIDAILARAKPALDSLLELRTLAAAAKAKFEGFVERLLYVELQISVLTLGTNQFDERRAYLTTIMQQLKAGVVKLEAMFEDMVNRHYDLLCKIATLYQKTIDLIEIANEINDYIQKMVKLIENGLLKEGDNIVIEYLESGFARISSTLEPYPERVRPKRQLIATKAINMRVPADVCPPVMPPCPGMDSGSGGSGGSGGTGGGTGGSGDRNPRCPDISLTPFREGSVLSFSSNCAGHQCWKKTIRLDYDGPIAIWSQYSTRIAAAGGFDIEGDWGYTADYGCRFREHYKRGQCIELSVNGGIKAAPYLIQIMSWEACKTKAKNTKKP